MGTLQFSNLSRFCSPPSPPSSPSTVPRVQIRLPSPLNQASLPHVGRIRAAEAVTEKAAAVTSEPEVATPAEPPSVDFAFVSSRLLPDGSPDIQIRSACGGQKLRDIMLDGHIDLYGPYARPLLNCGGGGTCGTCLVEVIEGKELLSPRTDKEKEALKKKPKTWRLACQTVVGTQESRGQVGILIVVIQQLPEWKAHDWGK
ncbi:hypothetical protein Taro_035245 [Colocasia esculenta]|uniref:2Fe-2S ferredoxin-type domain-containing protein n=1 Tax=Colocasia esculenta TaxID=4460 RepID=A0A843W557_COLES|nr:hypothetical protein [Colocasia esculenta]